MTATVSQNDAILALLRSGATLTPLAALELVGCFRLAARISDLRKAGHDIVTIQVPGQPFVRYQLARRPPPMTETEQRMLWGDR